MGNIATLFDDEQLEQIKLIMKLRNDDQKIDELPVISKEKKKQIEWESLEIPAKTKKISIKVDKSKDIKINQTDKEKKEMMAEHRKYKMDHEWHQRGYFGGWSDLVKEGWNEDKLYGIVTAF